MLINPQLCLSIFSQSTPESWAQFTHDNITRAEHERMASIQLRTLIDNILNDTSRDMREQADSVDVAFQKRVDEVQDAKNKMMENLKRVSHRQGEILWKCFICRKYHCLFTLKFPPFCSFIHSLLIWTELSWALLT